VNDGQSGTACPQCGSAAAVHSIGELAAMASSQLGQPQGSAPTPQAGYDQQAAQAAQFGYDQQAAQQAGYDQQAAQSAQAGYGQPSPQTGFGQPKPFDQPTSTDFNPPPPGGFGPPPPSDYQGPPPPGYSGSAQPGQPSQSTPSGPSGMPSLSRLGREFLRGGDVAGTIEDGVSDVVMGAAARFVGRKIKNRVQQVVNERVMPAMAARKDAMLREQISIAERHPDLRACLTDNVVFLAGGQRVLPLPSLAAGFTVEQSDALVARLRDG
jgi:hypothetical protein